MAVIEVDPAHKERIRLWLDALRSGNYCQGTGKLKYFDEGINRDRHCCLGVATDVFIQNSGESEVTLAFARESLDNDFLLPTTIGEWFGLETSDAGMGIGDPKVLTYYRDADVELVENDDDEDRIDADALRIRMRALSPTPSAEYNKTYWARVSMLNDYAGWDFHQIADALERTYL